MFVYCIESEHIISCLGSRKAVCYWVCDIIIFMNALPLLIILPIIVLALLLFVGFIFIGIRSLRKIGIRLIQIITVLFLLTVLFWMNHYGPMLH